MNAVQKPGRVGLVVLFAIYALALAGLILFKFPFSYDDTAGGRHVNLIPLAGSLTPAGTLRIGEIVENVVIFVPLGVYLCILVGRWTFARRVLVVVATTVAFEAAQYVFAIGRADITDVIANTLGGVIGIGGYVLVARVLGSKTHRALLITAAILTVTALGYYLVVFLRSATRS